MRKVCLRCLSFRPILRSADWTPQPTRNGNIHAQYQIDQNISKLYISELYAISDIIDIFTICTVCTSNPMRLYFFIFVGCATPTGRCLPAYNYWNRRACRTHGFLADGLRSEIGDTKAINLLKMLGSLQDLYWHRSKVKFGWSTCSSVCYVICIRFPTIPVFVLQRLNLWPLEAA